MMPRQTRESLSAGVAVTPRESSMPPRCFSPSAWSLDASLPIPRVLAGRVPRLPRYYQGTATSCRPSRRASFPSFGGTTGPRMFRSRRRCVGRRRAWGWLLGTPSESASVETTGSPKFLGNLNCPFAHALRLRRDNPSQTIRDGRAALGRGTAKAPARNRLSKLNNMAFRLAVYASQRRLPGHHARLAPRCWSTLLGGLSTRKVPLKGFQYVSLHPFLLSQACLAQSSSLFPVFPGKRSTSRAPGVAIPRAYRPDFTHEFC
jgi:hypothetical protein